MEIRIRPERPEDHRAVEELTREAFWNRHGPGCDEHYLVHRMRDKSEFIPELALVAEREGTIVGNIMYTRAVIQPEAGFPVPVLSFGPISVLPALQNRGIGKALIACSVARAGELGHRAVVIYGDPLVYASSGFVSSKRFGIYTARRTFLPSLLARELEEGALAGVRGAFLEAPFFDMDPAEVEAFDRGFPPKEKLTGLVSQLRFQELVNAGEPVG